MTARTGPSRRPPFKTMRPNLLSGLVCLLGIFFCGCGGLRPVDKEPIPPTESELLGTWVGLTEDDLCSFRISLRAGGLGLCAYACGQSPRLLAVEKWGMQGPGIEVSLAPIDADPNCVTNISGRAYATIMKVIVFGKGWRRELALRREDDLERQAAMLKSRMERFEGR